MSTLSIRSSSIFLVLVACATDPHKDHDHGDHEHHDHGGDSVCTEYDPSFIANETINGSAGHAQFTYTTNDPTPPEKGDNTMTLTLTDLDGNAITDATMTVEPFMTDHGHGTTPATFALINNGDGSYTSEAIDLFMSGVWDLTFTATFQAESTDTGTQDAETVDSAVFSFCIEG